jgi:hypothetical protein
VPNSSTKIPHFGAVIVGLGRAGLGLHIPVLAKVRREVAEPSSFDRIVAIVDNSESAIGSALHRLSDNFGYNPATLSCATSLDGLKGINPEKSVIHICTPENDHLPIMQSAVSLGYRRIIIEKPCAGNTADVDKMQSIVDKNGTSVAVINPYLYSRSVAACKEKIRQNGKLPYYLEMELSKPRKVPTIQGRSRPESVIDVELPHQIATALYLTDASRYTILRAEVRHMHYREQDCDPCKIAFNMGVGIIVIEFNHCITVLVSYLDAPSRTRFLKLRFENTVQVEVFLPVTEDDHTSEFVEYFGTNSDGTTDQRRADKLPDDMFTCCLSDIYKRFAANEAQLSDILFNRKVVDIMDRAKKLARIRR